MRRTCIREARRHTRSLLEALEQVRSPAPAETYRSEDDVLAYDRAQQAALERATFHAVALHQLVGDLDSAEARWHVAGVLAIAVAAATSAEAHSISGCGVVRTENYNLGPRPRLDSSQIVEFTVKLEEVCSTNLERAPSVLTLLSDLPAAAEARLPTEGRVCVWVEASTPPSWQLWRAPTSATGCAQ